MRCEIVFSLLTDPETNLHLVILIALFFLSKNFSRPFKNTSRCIIFHTTAHSPFLAFKIRRCVPSNLFYFRLFCSSQTVNSSASVIIKLRRSYVFYFADVRPRYQQSCQVSAVTLLGWSSIKLFKLILGAHRFLISLRVCSYFFVVSPCKIKSTRKEQSLFSGMIEWAREFTWGIGKTLRLKIPSAKFS